MTGKQAVADLKIKYENLMLDSTGEGTEEDDVLYRRMIEATPQAPESVQNGTADMWTHYCEVGENLLSVAYGEECSWCGERE